ncbi:MAG: segregation/condensation protein A, partial [Patescibacteria group bacterium]
MEEKNQFQIKTEVFEGPLDLLLSLIEKQKLHINDISLSKVTEDYIGYINAQKEFPLGQSADFILVASTLLLIKSKSLLPSLKLSADEAGDIEDLERRLKEYSRMKELSRHIRERFGKEVLFARLPSKEINPVFSPNKSMTVQGLFGVIRQSIANLPKVERLAQAVVDRIVSLEDMVKKITERVTQAMRTTFKEFSH